MRGMRQALRRVLVSSVVVAVTAATTVGWSAAVTPDGPTEGDGGAGDLDPAAEGDGTYEACDPSFGLGKPTLVALEFTMEGAPAPLTYPTDVWVAVDYPTVGGGTATCLPQVVTQELWDTRLWGAILGLPLPPGNLVLLPFDSDADDCPGPSWTLRVVGGPAGMQAPSVAVPWPLAPACSGGPEVVFGGVLTPPQIDALLALETGPYPVDGCNEDGTGTPSGDLLAAVTALIGALEPAFLELVLDAVVGVPECVAVEAAADGFVLQWLYDASVGIPVRFALTPVPEPEPVVVPTFTG
jgi:hypothetical protein